MNTPKLFDLTGKTAVVTGGGNGIGRACCLLLAEYVANIVVADFKLPDVQGVADEVRDTGGKALASVLTPEIERRMLAHTPLERLGEVEDIAGAVLYFAAPISWVSGQVLFVNGGGVQTLS